MTSHANYPRRTVILLYPLLALFILIPMINPAWSQTTEQPNIVVMMVDNTGWGELGVYGGGVLRGAPTPRLDKLASEGMQLLNFNVEPQCVPSRSAFMTGRHPIRSGTDRVVWGMLYGMVGWEKTMAELFSDAGYTTGMYGKWHLGDVKGRYPTDQGFDEFYGILNTTDEALYSSQQGFDPEVLDLPMIHRGKRGGELEAVKPYDVPARREIDADLARLSIDFMKRSVEAEKPFFAFIPFTQPHMPTLPHPDFDGKTGQGHYADVHVEIDHRAGQILDAIDELGIRDDTIVIWTSDNGPEYFFPWHGTSGPWRSHYFTAWEGSLRVPFLIRWPGKIQAEKKSNEIVHMIDLMPTFASVAGYDVPKDRMIDGVDQIDFFLGKQEKSNREGFPVYNGDQLFAYKWRDWKMHLMELESMNSEARRLNVPRLYNLISDPKEEYNVPAEQTWVVPVIFRRIVAFQKSLIEEPPIPLGTPEPWEPKK